MGARWPCSGARRRAPQMLLIPCDALRMAYAAFPRDCRLLNDPGPQTPIFLLRDLPRRLQLFELLDLIGDAVTDELAELVAGLLGPLLVPLGHAVTLREEIDEDADIGQQDEQDDPEDLAETRHVMAAEQV